MHVEGNDEKMMNKNARRPVVISLLPAPHLLNNTHHTAPTHTPHPIAPLPAGVCVCPPHHALRRHRPRPADEHAGCFWCVREGGERVGRNWLGALGRTPPPAPAPPPTTPPAHTPSLARSIGEAPTHSSRLSNRSAEARGHGCPVSGRVRRAPLSVSALPEHASPPLPASPTHRPTPPILPFIRSPGP